MSVSGWLRAKLSRIFLDRVGSPSLGPASFFLLGDEVGLLTAGEEGRPPKVLSVNLGDDPSRDSRVLSLILDSCLLTGAFDGARAGEAPRDRMPRLGAGVLLAVAAVAAELLGSLILSLRVGVAGKSESEGKITWLKNCTKAKLLFTITHETPNHSL